MKHPFTQLTLWTVFLAVACTAPKDQSIIVTSARAPGDSCDFSDPTKVVQGGSIDLSVNGPNSFYDQVFGWQNDLQDISVIVNGQQITTNTPNTFLATAIQDSYVLVKGTNPPTGFVNISASIAAGGTTLTNDVGVSLLTQDAAIAICGAAGAIDACPAFTGPSQNLLVTFVIMGNLVGGSSAQTNAVTYPLTLFKGGNFDYTTKQCINGTVPQVTTCNIPGRDIPYCVTP